MNYHLSLLLLTLFILPLIHARQRAVPVPPSAGSQCVLRRLSRDCASPSRCVVKDFGEPGRTPPTGVCSTFKSLPPYCNIESCASRGANALCRMSGDVATCSAWATRRDGGSAPTCKLDCPSDCPADAVSSTGETFCNACKLFVASCVAQFAFFGPVLPENVEKACSSQVDLRGAQPPCSSGYRCVIKDFGFPLSDIPNEGICKKMKKRASMCTISGCMVRGKDHICEVDNMTTTCGVWASGGAIKRELDCSVQSCKPKLCAGSPFRSSDGKRYCSWCALKTASCISGFAITAKRN